TARGENYTGSIQSGISFTLDLTGEKVPVSIHGVLGKVYLYSLLAAAVVGKARNIPLADIVKSLNRYEAPRGRMNIIPGINGSMLIDDTYNSSPDAVMSALETLKELKSEVTSNAIKEDFGLVNLSNIPIGQVSHRKIAVLGDMMELGRFSTDEHRKIGKEVASIVNILITVGPRARMIAEEAIKSGMPADYVKCFNSSLDAAPYVASIASPGDIILVKGSQSPRLERVTKALLREPEKADKLLVRQEEEWGRRP
ncbi:MAG: cyanophycin synthetase, partial [Patescibacteria group bacterium]